MPLTRTECGNMSDTLLQVNIDGCVHRLRRDWEKGRPGGLSTIYDLALLHTEAMLRSWEAQGPLTGIQLTMEVDELA